MRCDNEMEIIDYIFLLGILGVLIPPLLVIRSILRERFFDMFSGLDFSQTLVLSVNILGEYLSYSKAYDDFLENCNETEKRFASLITSKQSSDVWMHKNWKLIKKMINEVKTNV